MMNTIKHHLRSLTRNEDGTIAMMFALCLLPIVFAAGAAVDYTRISHTKAIVSQALDAAVIATAKSLSEGAKADAKLEQEFNDFFYANLEGRTGFSDSIRVVSFKADEDSGSVEATVDSDVPMTFMQLIGKQEITVPTASQVVFDIADGSAVSMFLVLDKSGSMAGQNKINDLKDAVSRMNDQFKINDPDKKYVRVGAVAYDSSTKPELPITWGGDAANSYTKALYAQGGTASSGAMSIAYNRLTNPAEEAAHTGKNGQKSRKVIVFLTDGNNNRSVDDVNTKQTCTQAKNQNVEVYSIAFKAPVRGQQLLKFCASTTDHYFDAQNRQDLIKAFEEIGAAVVGDLVLTM